jgi:hypothetical protein
MRSQKSRVSKNATPRRRPPSSKPSLTPGDAEVERNSRLIIEARFDGPVPADAMLVVSEADGKVRDRLPMRLTVDGAGLRRHDREGGPRYEIPRRVRQSEIAAAHASPSSTFPRLVRSDVIVTPPEYTKLPAERDQEHAEGHRPRRLEDRVEDQGQQTARHGPIPFSPHLTAAELFRRRQDRHRAQTSSATDPTLLEATMHGRKDRRNTACISWMRPIARTRTRRGSPSPCKQPTREDRSRLPEARLAGLQPPGASGRGEDLR